MLVLGMNPGHNGSIAAIRDRKLLLSAETEKDTLPRYSPVSALTVLDAAAFVDELPDIVALGGWHHPVGRRDRSLGVGYWGPSAHATRDSRFFGKPVTWYSSSHERSHLMLAIGMAPLADSELEAVLIWEGDLGSFHLVDSHATVVQTVRAMDQPGARYATLFALADRSFPDHSPFPRLEDAGKVMALAAHGEAPDASVVAVVSTLLNMPSCYPVNKARFKHTCLYNAGVESKEMAAAARLMTASIFEVFRRVAEAHLPRGVPLRISGGCGLNCDWNRLWIDTEQFSSVFVPPCTDDSGAAIGTAIDALEAQTGNPRIEWSVYSGLPFVFDVDPVDHGWKRRPLDVVALAADLRGGALVPWVQGRAEIGLRALGHRSLLAEPYRESTRDRLNAIKRREGYRPIAPCCRVEDLSLAWNEPFEDPYMLYFRRTKAACLTAVTHVDGTARVQTVNASEQPLHELLSAFGAQTGLGVLCNTSLNFPGHGFINRMSDLLHFCDETALDEFVVDADLFAR